MRQGAQRQVGAPRHPAHSWCFLSICRTRGSPGWRAVVGCLWRRGSPTPALSWLSSGDAGGQPHSVGRDLGRNTGPWAGTPPLLQLSQEAPVFARSMQEDFGLRGWCHPVRVTPVSEARSTNHFGCLVTPSPWETFLFTAGVGSAHTPGSYLASESIYRTPGVGQGPSQTPGQK